MSDGRQRPSRPAGSHAQVAAGVTPVIGVVERALNFIVFQQRAPLFVSRMLHRSVLSDVKLKMHGSVQYSFWHSLSFIH